MSNARFYAAVFVGVLVGNILAGFLGAVIVRAMQ